MLSKKQILVVVSCFVFLIPGIIYLVGRYVTAPNNPIVTPIGTITPSRVLDKYAISALAQREPQGADLQIGEILATASAFSTYNFSFTSEGKRVTGIMNIPNTPAPPGGYPVIVQLRGYVDKSIYEPGIGTRRSGEVFAANGYMTFAPDFLGYGNSDAPSTDIFEERFQTYTVVLDLLAVIPTYSQINPNRMGLWGHSNGGHIAITVLEILKKPIPTTLWAPVTKPFPYSILYFTDEAEDGGKFLRKSLAHFEETYDTDKYSLMTYLDSITAPIQLHQGTADAAVPLHWSTVFVDQLKERDKDITYFVYSGADHNMQGSWNTVVERDIIFFNTHLPE